MQRPPQRFAGISLAVVSLFLAVASSATAQTVFSGTGANSGVALNDFLTAIGGPNNGATPGTQASGFRRITWDGVATPATGADTNINANTTGIVVGKFANRGALYDQVYAVANDGFASVNPEMAGQFNAFSPAKTFAPFNGNTISQKFVVPGAGSTAPAFTRGFGAIFNDVDLGQTTRIEFFSFGTSLGSFLVDPDVSGGTSFLGVLFPAAIVTDVTLTLGNATVFTFDGVNTTSGGLESGGTDLVVTDDFVFAETVTVPEPGTLGLACFGLMGLVGVSLTKRRK